jgi:hypothetical protein
MTVVFKNKVALYARVIFVQDSLRSRPRGVGRVARLFMPWGKWSYLTAPPLPKCFICQLCLSKLLSQLRGIPILLFALCSYP